MIETKTKSRRAFRRDNVNGLAFVIAILALTIGVASLAEARFRASDILMNDIIVMPPEK